jgi:aryl-alcohol dehydrogenase-like predicted oxidoreductase
MMRVSDISSPSDFIVERQREKLRDQRCRRRCDAAMKISHALRELTGALRNTVGAIALAWTLSHFLGWL